MRVAHISDCYLPRTGGIELQVQGLAQAQQAAGHDPRVITATQAPDPMCTENDSDDDAIPVLRLGVPLPYDLPVTHRVGRSLRRALAHDTDVVHIHAGLVSPFAWPALRTAVQGGLPVVVTVHSVWGEWARAFAAADVVFGWRNWPVAWTAVSDVAATPIRQALAGRREVTVLGNGIDIGYWQANQQEQDARLSRPPSEVTVVAVGRLAARKRGHALIDILARARAEVPESIRLRAIIIGDGPERGAIERTLANRGPDWVHCTGWQTRTQIREHFADADIFVSAGKLESFCIAALEARTFGLPVVALDASGVTEFVRDGREGLLAPDDAGLASAIARLATDSRLRTTMTEHNTTVEPSFGWPTMVARTDAVYGESFLLRP